ncbi:MAG: hemerythrin domain-containing protein [Isosphaeraceae bacterium]|jgi:hemerythrin-like domain-containing protein
MGSERNLDRGTNMKATDTMMEEHRLILRVLRCLSAAADQAEKAPGLDVESIQKMLEFFRGFADRCHHAKEEAHFFPLARQRGVGCPPASIDSLLTEHQEGRDHIRVMDENLSGAGSGERQAKVRFLQHARQYVQLLTDHIGKEDHCLFPTADTMLSTADQGALVKAFEELEQQELGAGTHERFHALADELCAKWDVPIPQRSTHQSGCSHS